MTKAILGPDDDFRDYVNPNSLKQFDAVVQTDFLDYVKQGDIVQLERMGFYFVDKVDGEGCVLHYVPEGKKKC